MIQHDNRGIQMKSQDSTGRQARRPFSVKAVLFGGLLAMVVAGAACQEATAVPNTSAAAGNYVLLSINDTVLPRTVRKDTNYQLQITSDTLALSAFGTWADLTIYAETSGTETLPNTNLALGKYSISGGTINFETYQGDKFSGSISNNSVIITGTTRALYIKQ